GEVLHELNTVVSEKLSEVASLGSHTYMGVGLESLDKLLPTDSIVFRGNIYDMD
ncbi:hypothetical protein K7432_016521, partial [Basidiobolus ranarum]